MKRWILTLMILWIGISRQSANGCPIIITEDTLSYVEGRVLDENNDPLFSAIVFLMQNGARKAAKMTDSAGYFKLGPVAPGAYFLIVKYVGYPDIMIDSIILKPEKTIEIKPVIMQLAEGRNEVRLIACSFRIDKPSTSERLKKKISEVINSMKQGAEKVLTQKENIETTVYITCGRNEEPIKIEEAMDSVSIETVAIISEEDMVSDSTVLTEPEEKLVISALNISVFPNPTTDKVKLTANLAAEQPVQLQILDAAGKMVMQQQLDFRNQANYTFDLKAYSHGTYFFRMQYMGETHTEKVIKLR